MVHSLKMYADERKMFITKFKDLTTIMKPEAYKSNKITVDTGIPFVKRS